VKEVISVILDELNKLKTELVSEVELNKVKQNLIGTMYLGLESSDSLAKFYGGQEIMNEVIKTPEVKTPVITEQKPSQSMFYGTGQYEKTSETSFGESKRNINVQRLSFNNLERESEITKTNLDIKSDVINNQSKRPKTKESEVFKTEEATKIKDEVIPKEIVKPRQKINQLEIYREKLKNKETTPIPPILDGNIELPKSSNKSISRFINEKFGSFDVFVKAFKKDVKVGTFGTQEAAEKFLKSKLKSTLRASGKIVKGGKAIDFGELKSLKTMEFRPSKVERGRVVQKREFRLGSKSEVQEIGFFKKGRTKKNSLGL
jgi:hypothetical protein